MILRCCNNIEIEVVIMDMPEEQLRRLLELESSARALWAEAATRIPEDAWGHICRDVATR